MEKPNKIYVYINYNSIHSFLEPFSKFYLHVRIASYACQNFISSTRLHSLKRIQP